MAALKAKLTLNKPADNSLKEAVSRKKASQETLAEAWQRIESLKNNDADKRMIGEVKVAMNANKIGREPESLAKGKRFSKAEIKRLYPEVKAMRQQEILDDMVANMPDNYWLVQTEEKFAELLVLLEKETTMIFDVETTGTNVWQDYLVGHVIGCYNADIHAYIPVRHDTDQPQLDADYVAAKLKPFYENPNIKKVAHNGGFDMAILENDLGIKLQNLYFDTMPAMVMLNENEPSFALKNLATKYLDMPSLTYSALFGKKGFNEVSDLAIAGAYAIKDSDLTMRLMGFQLTHLNRFPSIKKYFFDVEMPLVSTIVDMEATGFVIDEVYAKEYGKKLKAELDELEQELTEAFNGININSPAQLKPELERLTNRQLDSVDAKRVLKPLAKEFPLIQKYLKYKAETKLYGTYISVLPDLIEKRTGRLMPSFNPSGAKTGRFSSGGSGTNLQNQPGEARKLFKAPDGEVIIGLDFSAQEVRCLAYRTQDPLLLDAYNTGKDMYSTLAAQVFGKSYEQVGNDTPERKKAKTALLAMLYGTGPATMAMQLGITPKEAKQLMKDMFATMPQVSRWIEEAKAFVRQNGFVWIGDEARKRRLPQAADRMATYGDRSRAERQAVNGKIQGESAIQTKVTLNNMSSWCREQRSNGRNFRVLATIHDEILVTAPFDVTGDERDNLVEIMTTSYPFGNVPLKSDVEIYMERWGEAVRWQEFIKKRGY